MNMASTLRWTTADLEALPEDNRKRYEIIDGELYVSTTPHWNHQQTLLALAVRLDSWNLKNRAGQINLGPGVIFSEDSAVAPDIVWLSNQRISEALREDGKLHAAPELIIEVLSRGRKNERRDRETKLKLYSSRGVDEYWIVNWQLCEVEIYRRAHHHIELVAKLTADDNLQSPLLPGFSCSVGALFENLSK
jgi:Uma2 family endonuclease